jgi:hypothetical protein
MDHILREWFFVISIINSIWENTLMCFIKTVYDPLKYQNPQYIIPCNQNNHKITSFESETSDSNFLKSGS